MIGIRGEIAITRPPVFEPIVISDFWLNLFRHSRRRNNIFSIISGTFEFPRKKLVQ